jgi:hypothetical protein
VNISKYQVSINNLQVGKLETQLFAGKNHFIINGTAKAELVIRDSGELPKIVLTKERVTLQPVGNSCRPSTASTTSTTSIIDGNSVTSLSTSF